MPIEDGDVELRRGVIEVLCWAACRYYVVVHLSSVVGILQDLGLDIRRSTIADCLRRLVRRGYLERVALPKTKAPHYRLTKQGEMYLEMQFLGLQRLLNIAGWLMNRDNRYSPQDFVRHTYTFASDSPRKR
jgi:hypothetical protein